ncbi:VOC family protein [Chitinophaga horti]|uniref:VOC family protein n=1 Tax=Chitinophaga horti TaxID=2920382 RepID=A0ABY6J4T6_9BACT|nr:VOC family protein [Chitinophaga horti]UYQ94510.1 VOC family protein [Chitinophaga horti]
MLGVNPYLNFKGTCRAAFDFYKSVFGGEFVSVIRFGDLPEACPGVEDEIMHISLPIGDGSMLMGSDFPGGVEKAIHGNTVFVCLGGDDETECRRLFDGLSAGGEVHEPFQQAPWGDIFGDFTDKFGIKWMVNCLGTKA